MSSTSNMEGTKKKYVVSRLWYTLGREEGRLKYIYMSQKKVPKEIQKLKQCLSHCDSQIIHIRICRSTCTSYVLRALYEPNKSDSLEMGTSMQIKLCRSLAKKPLNKIIKSK